MENLGKWTIIAFGLNENNEELKTTLSLAQWKLSEISIALSDARNQILSMFYREVSCEDLVFQEKNIVALGKLLVKSRMRLMNHIVHSCIESIRKFKLSIEISSSVLTEETAALKLKCMQNILELINQEEDLQRTREINEKLYEKLCELRREISSFFYYYKYRTNIRINL